MNFLSRLTTLNLDLILKNLINPVAGFKKNLFGGKRERFISVMHNKKYPPMMWITVAALKVVHMSKGFWEGW